MKCRVSVIVMQGDSRYHPASPNYLKIMVDRETKEFPSAYLSTRSIEETVQSVYGKYCNLDIRWASPILSDVRHGRFKRWNFVKNEEVSELETEILYRVLIPEGVIGLKNRALLASTYEISKLKKLEDFYVRSIIETPRSTQQR